MSVQEPPVVVADAPRDPVVTDPPTRSVVQAPADVTARQDIVTTSRRPVARTGPGAAEMARRVVVLVFGLIQIVIGLRIVLLLLDARTGNALVSTIHDVSQVFVAPFNGVLNSDAFASGGGSVLDVSAIVALVAWTILELIVVWALGIFRREPAYTA